MNQTIQPLDSGVSACQRAKPPQLGLSSRMMEQIRRGAQSADSKAELLDSIFATIVDHQCDPSQITRDQWKQIVVAAIAAADANCRST